MPVQRSWRCYEQDTRRKTQDIGHRTQDARGEPQAARHKTQDARQTTQSARHKTQGARHTTQDTRHTPQDTRPKTQGARHTTQDTRHKTHDARRKRQDLCDGLGIVARGATAPAAEHECVVALRARSARRDLQRTFDRALSIEHSIEHSTECSCTSCIAILARPGLLGDTPVIMTYQLLFISCHCLHQQRCQSCSAGPLE